MSVFVSVSLHTQLSNHKSELHQTFCQWRHYTRESGATATDVKLLATGLIGRLMVTDQLNFI